MDVKPPIWFAARFRSIKQRCANPEHKTYKNYGGRGIKLKFDNYRDMWAYMKDLEHCSKDMTIDRKNNDGNYEKGNLRWVSRHVQNINRRIVGKGVRQVNDSPRWQARTTLNHKEVYLGTFITEAEAVAAVRGAQKFRSELYG